MPTSRDLTAWFKCAGIVAGLWLLAGCAAPQRMAAAAGPVPPGQARI